MKSFVFIVPVLVSLAGCYSIPYRDEQGNKRELKSDLNLDYSKDGFSSGFTTSQTCQGKNCSQTTEPRKCSDGKHMSFPQTTFENGKQIIRWTECPSDQ